ncbi:MAG: hypothetical protein JWO49_3024 [Arthrobacter sp.]|jgi:hypothetical protein|nr:hypothetical protein [Arthrobacter sp.]
MAEPMEPKGLMAPGGFRRISVVQSARLADVPSEAQWFANLTSVQTQAR